MRAVLDSAAPIDSAGGGPVGIGAIVDRTYKLLSVLGRGGMGTVYEAEHLRLGARVAIKVLRGASDERSARRLLREACLTARINTDHVVRVNDCGTLPDGSPYVVMERLQGEDLRSLLAREQQLSVQAALRIAEEVCAGLVDLHAVGVVHRDIKPANVFVLNAVHGRCRCKLIDLGIARVCDGDTSSLVVLGSIRYMAPEQLAESKRTLPQSDVYALGIILYQCLTGKFPHQGETAEDIAVSILNRRVRPISELRSEVSPALSALIMSAIDRDPSARPSSAAEFARSLSAFSAANRARSLGPGPHDTTRQAPSEFRRAVGRGRVLLLGLVATLALSSVLLMFRTPPASVPLSVTPHPPQDVRASERPVSVPAAIAASTSSAFTVVTAPPAAPRSSSAESKRERARAVEARTNRRDTPPSAGHSGVTDLGLDGNPYAQ